MQVPHRTATNFQNEESISPLREAVMVEAAKSMPSPKTWPGFGR
jgi:hypothetical protein